MSVKWDLIYELRTDEERVRRVREDTAETPYRFGTKEWWAALDAGAIERQTIEGAITEAHPTSLVDPQDFGMLTADGSELTGARHGDPTRYVEGLHLRFEYVTVRRAGTAFSEPDGTADVVIAVWVEHSHRRTPFLHSVLPPFPWPIDFDRDR